MAANSGESWPPQNGLGAWQWGLDFDFDALMTREEHSLAGDPPRGDPTIRLRIPRRVSGFAVE